jgi:translocation and assembly module TamB
MVGGQWDASGSGSDALQVHAILERTRGDVQLASDEAGAAPLPAGVRTARLKVSVANEQVQAELNWDSANAGTVQAHAGTWLQRQGTSWTWPANAPLEGVLRAQLPRLRVWSLLAPPGWRLRGTLDANATLSGTRGDPQWSGTLDAHDLAIRSVLDGVDFNQGVMRLKLEGDGLEIAELTAHGATAGGAGGGVLSITGQLRWPVMDPSTAVASRLRGTLRASAQGLRVSTRADQRLVVSGSVSAQLQDATLTLAGNLVADQAAFVLAQDTAPRLGDDVHLGGLAAPVADNFPVPAKTAPPGTRITPVVNITLDLGENFLIEGQGLVTRLAGKLALTTSGNFTPRLAGEIRTINGTYKAYGQQLDVEDGVLRFSGPYDNPALDILAIRPNLLQRVGVQISGTALSPVVRLYAEPDLPDAEKLSWLVTGRANAEGGAQIALLQQAAMAMLGRNGNTVSGGLAQSLGLDEISMGGLGSTTSSDGTAAAGATVKLGKRLAGNFYVAYERSVAGAYGTFYIFYDLTKRFTLRGQTGEQSAVDLIFTTRHD